MTERRRKRPSDLLLLKADRFTASLTDQTTTISLNCTSGIFSRSIQCCVFISLEARIHDCVRGYVTVCLYLSVCIDTCQCNRLQTRMMSRQAVVGDDNNVDDDSDDDDKYQSEKENVIAKKYISSRLIYPSRV